MVSVPKAAAEEGRLAALLWFEAVYQRSQERAQANRVSYTQSAGSL